MWLDSERTAAHFKPSPFRCVAVVPRDATPHVAQVLTGLELLRRNGVVSYRLQTCEQSPVWGSHARVMLQLAGTGELCLDAHDSDFIDEDALHRCLLYFKRSFDTSRHPVQNSKLRPLGLNYEIYADGFNWKALLFAAARMEHRRTIRLALGAVGAGPRPRLSELEPRRAHEVDERVLFMPRLWDPAEVESTKEREERIAINEKRVECLLLLRRHFGKRFTGGLVSCPLSTRSHPSLVLQDAETSRNNYLKLVQEHAICVATAGLHASTGWKFAEYVALSRAIVCERPRFAAPGLSEGENYLAFDEPDECLANCEKLLTDRRRRIEMMQANRNYYYSSLRPDVLVLNALNQALQRSIH